MILQSLFQYLVLKFCNHIFTSHLLGVYHKKGVSTCLKKEKRIVEKLKNAIPNMSEFDKGYILGKTESFSENKSDDSDQKGNEKGA